jgi:Flp pilus assembly protein TadD
MELTIEQALQQGITAHKEGKLEDAERFYRAILQTQPEHPDANHNLGVIAVSLDKADVALPLFKTALKANLKIDQFWLSYIDALIKEKQFENAKAVIEQAKNQGMAEEKLNVLEGHLASKNEKEKIGNISLSQAQLNTMLEHYQNGRFDDAEKLAILTTQEFPTYQLAWTLLGAILGQSGRNSEAVNAFQTAVKLSPQDASAHNNLGVTLKELGRLEDAEASYTKAIAFKPDLAEAHNNLGNTYNELGRLEAAETSYSQAILLQPDYAEAHSNLGKTLQELGRLDEAVASYTQAIAFKPDYAEAHNNLGNTLKELGRLEEAETSYSQAILLQPDYYDALYNRWVLLFENKRYEAALKNADLCTSKNARGLDLITLYALGRTEEIYKRIEIQSKINSDNISIAAFTAFFAELEKKHNAYKFCSNPMDFMHFSNLSSNLKDSNAYITELVKELDKVKIIWEPMGKSTTGGFQTVVARNLFKSPSGKIAQLKSIIIDELDAYYLKFRNQSCSYIKKWPSRNNLWGWHVVLKQQGYQIPHIHTTGWLSGVIYLKVVPSLGKDEGAIEFSLNSKHYHNVNSPSLMFQPEVGDIVFFPSSLHHKTIPFSTDADRIIVSFDLIPEVAKH